MSEFVENLVLNLFDDTLSIKDCMFITPIIENSEGCATTKFDKIGHTHRLEEA